MKRKRYEFWIHLISSEWFICFLEYLRMEEIAQLDSSFLNHADRCIWLVSLKSYRPKSNVKISSVQFAKWLILKDICLQKLSLDLSISDESIILQLLKICPKLKDLTISDKTSNHMTLSFQTLIGVAMIFQKLKCLDMSNIQIPDGGLEILSIVCHQLKVIVFVDINMIGLNKLIEMNHALTHLRVESSIDCPSIGELFDTLGLNCPQLRFFIYNFKKQNISTTEIEATHAQIETFTRGCPKLETLSLIFGIPLSTTMYDKLFYCLGNYNPYLTNLSMLLLFSSTLQPSETVINDSLQILSNGCPLLRDCSITNANIRVSTQAVTYLVNHSIHLETLNLSLCCICDDRLIITKETDKLNNLESLGLSLNLNITDESIINLVTDCHNLEEIHIQCCPKLTDTSLFSISMNCLQLEKIYLDFDGNKITIAGLKELINKCPKLIKIDSCDELPNEIEEELLRRRNTRISRTQ